MSFAGLYAYPPPYGIFFPQIVTLSLDIITKYFLSAGIVKEFLQQNCTVDKILPHFFQYLDNPELATKLKKDFTKLDQMLDAKSDPYQKAAKFIAEQFSALASE